MSAAGAELAVPYPDENPRPCASDASDDRADLEALHVEFFSRLVRLCTNRLRDRGLAEDIAQDTLLRARRYWDSYDTTRATWPWLKTIALRLCIDAGRDRSHEVYAGDVSDQPDAVDRTERLLEKLTVHSALAALPERQRLALQLRYFDDRDRESSAEVLGVSVNAFDQLLNRARQRLAMLLDPERAGTPLAVIFASLGWLRRRAAIGWLQRWAASGFAPLSSAEASLFMGATACLVCLFLPQVAAGREVRALPPTTFATHAYSEPRAIPSDNAHRAIGRAPSAMHLSRHNAGSPPASGPVTLTKRSPIGVIAHPPKQTQTRVCVGVFLPGVQTICIYTPHDANAHASKPADAPKPSVAPLGASGSRP